MTEAHAGPGRLSLQGGPLYRLGTRLGLVRGRTNTVLIGVALGLLLWVVVVGLSLAGGIGERIFAIAAIGGHLRLLVVIPLFFLCESLLDPRLTTFVETIVRARVVPARELPVLESEIARIGRWRDSWLPEIVCLLAAILFSAASSSLNLPGASSTFEPARGAGGVPLAGQWYWFVCLPLFRFLMLRWAWRLGLWCFFLWRVSKLDLELIPTHPDGAGGLGYLELVHTHFLPLAFALSTLEAGSLAEEIALGRIPFEGVYPALALVLVLQAVLFLGPLLLFAPKLWACRVNGLSGYMELASSYVSGFDAKWLKPRSDPGEPLLGTADLQSLADLNNSVAIVRNMRSVPISARLLTDLGLATLLPMLPLLMMKYPIDELARKFLARLSGL